MVQVALFRPSRLGDGQWMRDWCERVKEDGAVLFSEEGLICNELPTTTHRLPACKLGWCRSGCMVSCCS